MARIRRWKEMLVVWLTLFASVVWARSRSNETGDHSGAARSLLVTSSGGKRAWGVTLSAARPFVHAFSVSAVPVALPKPVGAFATSAAAMADRAPNPAAAPGAVSSCVSSFVCYTPTAPHCSKTYATCCNPNCETSMGVCDGCWQLTCFQGGEFLCTSCGMGTCNDYECN